LKYPVILAALVVLLLAVTLFPAPPAAASQAYTESLTAYVAGTNALWFMSFGGVNASAPSLGAIEAQPGVSWYNITLLKTTSWSSDFQIFGPNGYNLVPTPFLPSQGAFFTVGADSYGTASTAASSVDPYLLTTFASYSNSSGVYTFYAPLTFLGIAPTLMGFLPSAPGGFAAAISESAFVTLQSPIVSLQGVREGSAFVHTLTLGSIASKALNSNSQPTVMTYFGATVTSLQASGMSSSSTIAVKFLDGEANSTDRSAVVTNSGGEGSYTLTLATGQKVHSLNVTVDQTPTLLLARRAIDRGVLMHGQNLSVTISLSNPYGPSSLRTAGFSDGWWRPYGFFKVVKGNSTIPAEAIPPGGSVSPTYVLEYTGNGTRMVTIPSTAVSYTYNAGLGGFRGSGSTEPVTLSLGQDNSVVYALLVPAKGYEGAVGTTQRFNITVRNVGTLTAPSVVAAGQQEGGLVAGASTTVPIPVTTQTLTGANSTLRYQVSSITPSGQNITTSTNTVPLLFTHSAMALGMPTLTATASVAQLGSGRTNLTLSFAGANGGSANLTGFTASGKLPAGLVCGSTKGSGVTCTAGMVEMSLPTLFASQTWRGSMEFDLPTPQNYLIAPFTFHAQTAGVGLRGRTNAVAAPSGVVLTKEFVPPSLFGGMSATVLVTAVNRGPFAAYNATIRSTADTFDGVTTFSPLPLKSVPTIGVGSPVIFNYTVIAAGVYGNLTSTPTTASLYFGGVQYALSQPGPEVSVFRTLTVSIVTSPASPTEGSPFSIGIAIRNPSPATVSNVQYTLPIPSSMALSNLQNAVYQGGNLTVTAATLGPQQSLIANATAQASSGVSVLFSKGELGFTYAGATLKSPQSSNKGIVVGEDVLTRYTIPIALVLVCALAVAFFLRRKIFPISPGSQQ
jgi:hypothetical protein